MTLFYNHNFFKSVLLLVMISSIVILPVYAQSDEQREVDIQKNLDVEIIQNTTEFVSGNTVNIILKIHNNQEQKITLENMMILTIFGYDTPQQERILTTTTIGPKSSISELSYYDLPDTIPSGTYILSAVVKGENEISGTGWTKITIASPTSLSEVFESKLNNILVLFIAFALPAQLIERIVEYTYPHYRASRFLQILKREKMNLEQDGVYRHKLEQVRDRFEKYLVNNPNNTWYEFLALPENQNERDWIDAHHKHIHKDAFNQKVFNKTKIESLEKIREKKIDSDMAYSSVEALDKEIHDAKVILEHDEKHTALITWGLATIFALVPGAIFALSKLGIFQIMGETDEMYILIDFIFNSLLIGSSTKPIHDIIDQIKKIRK